MWRMAAIRTSRTLAAAARPRRHTINQAGVPEGPYPPGTVILGRQPDEEPAAKPAEPQPQAESPPEP